mmetsp:Transcript_108142/g.170512  ORF Transcript_108142/g.170512 Transcript_108142/m.170512 type:complete len:154 (-) Transcript_108142:144-605(-)
MGDLCKQWAALEIFCNGCRKECDQKCVIDNYEVEILQGPGYGYDISQCGTEHCFCPSSRPASITELCTPRQIVGYYTDGPISRSGPASRSLSFRSQLASGFTAPTWGTSGVESERSYLSSGHLGSGLSTARFQGLSGLGSGLSSGFGSGVRAA